MNRAVSRNLNVLSRGICLAAFLVLIFVGAVHAEEGDLLKVAPAGNEAFFGARIQRTMSLLATSNESRRNPVKILFWGQSIVAQNWTEMVIEDLKSRYPYADITYENRAIGGFTAPALVRTSVHDLYPFYPDLVVFHVYGGEESRELERIISNIRRYTTAEILVYTHHIAQFADRDTDEYKKRHQSDDRSADLMRFLAQEYGCELVDVRTEWARYLDDHGLEPRELLKDGIHLKEQGCRLMAVLVARHFRFNSLFPSDWTDMVRTCEAKRAFDEGARDEIVFTGKPWIRRGASAVGDSPESALKLSFEGNRIDIITGPSGKDSTLGTARVFIDGTVPSRFPELCEFTRPSKAHGSWMPAIRRVGHREPLLIEDWTLRITDISDDAKDFSFVVTGSVTGEDGSGSNADVFVSNSGRVVIEPRDFMITWTQNYFKKKCPVGFEVSWSVQPLFRDTYEPSRINSNSGIEIVTVAKCLKNGPHILEIVPNGDGDIPIEAISVHMPPLK